MASVNIVSSKFHNFLLLKRKRFTSYFLKGHVVLFIHQSPEQIETCSAVFGNFHWCGIVFYQARYVRDPSECAYASKVATRCRLDACSSYLYY